MLDLMRPGRVEIHSCSLDPRIKTVKLGKAVVLPIWFGQSMDQKEQKI